MNAEIGLFKDIEEARIGPEGQYFGLEQAQILGLCQPGHRGKRNPPIFSFQNFDGFVLAQLVFQFLPNLRQEYPAILLQFSFPL